MKTCLAERGGGRPSPPRSNKNQFVLFAALTALTGAGCAETRMAGAPSALDARGPAAESIVQLWWIMFILGVLVLLLVGALLIYVAVGARRGEGEDGAGLIDEARGRRWIWLGGVVLPVLILPIIFFFNLQSLARMSSGPGPDTLLIEVTGHRWWWHVSYPNEQIVTANEIHIPVGRPVQLVLHSNDVIHSFWAPQLHGKIDMVPGETNTLELQADVPGSYRGLCAEFCGAQHARMQFLLVASEPHDFEQWLARQQQPAPQPADEATLRGQQVFLGSACVYCHTVRGTNASGTLGPDLTHLGSRQTLAAGVLPNTTGHLAGWILNPQAIKPGNLMPPTPLPSEDLNSLLLYLSSLD